jgi:hypothetical protein
LNYVLNVIVSTKPSPRWKEFPAVVVQPLVVQARKPEQAGADAVVAT